MPLVRRRRSTYRVAISLTPEVMTRVTELAKAAGKPVAAVIRELVEKGLAKHGGANESLGTDTAGSISTRRKVLDRDQQRRASQPSAVNCARTAQG